MFFTLESSAPPPVQQDTYGIQSNPDPPEMKEEPVETKEEVEDDEEDEDEEEEETPSKLSFFLSI